MMALGNDGQLYRPHVYKVEAEFERTVLELADAIFGDWSVYLPVKKKMGKGDLVTIPDAYVIDMVDATSPRLFVVENEIVGHDAFNHIGVQMLRFVTSFDDARETVRKFLTAAVLKSDSARQRIEAARAKAGSRSLDHYVELAVDRPFNGLVIIDEAREELHRVLSKIHAEIAVLELSTFVSATGQRVHVFDSLYDEEGELEARTAESGAESESPEARTGRQQYLLRRATSDTVIVPAHKDGFEKVFLGENQWRAISIGAAMRDRIRYIAAYQVAPVSAVTHIAEVKAIVPFGNSGKFAVMFKGPALPIGPIKLRESKNKPQSRIYARSDRLRVAEYLEDALS